jgi:hypothetical protein
MPLLTPTELEPLQAARRIAEEHLETIRTMALSRLKAMPATYRDDDAFTAENNRYHKIADVVGALQTIYDNVSELEFEEEDPAEAKQEEPPQDPEEDEDETEDEDDEDDEEEEDED